MPERFAYRSSLLIQNLFLVVLRDGREVRLYIRGIDTISTDLVSYFA